MNLHEYQAKELFRNYGLPVSVGRAVQTPDEAVAAATELGGDRWVCKVQVHAGGRGKAGGVKLSIVWRRCASSPRTGPASAWLRCRRTLLGSR